MANIIGHCHLGNSECKFKPTDISCYDQIFESPSIRLVSFCQDLKGTIVQVADYLGHKFSDDVLDQMVNNCTFKSMKKNPDCNPDSLGFNEEEIKGEKKTTIGKEEEDKQSSFMRKGMYVFTDYEVQV